MSEVKHAKKKKLEGLCLFLDDFFVVLRPLLIINACVASFDYASRHTFSYTVHNESNKNCFSNTKAKHDTQ